jgi:hypothetical protein
MTYLCRSPATRRNTAIFGGRCDDRISTATAEAEQDCRYAVDCYRLFSFGGPVSRHQIG